ncbi:MAG: hypothetical protein WBZ36_17325 [Candidatus Nitrosopolaris sp.]
MTNKPYENEMTAVATQAITVILNFKASNVLRTSTPGFCAYT